ncbi:class I SAM-dependent methyltransferase [Oxynema aestuarii]|uniref:Class I SAM-dependent methyltransferase n=1 Tax=Oxynema aestuarii AP17 TaxID=2064643 RepID=A0A6H1TZL1_9CYAN|nr:methyltransferase domain-containing protein [Oxynema aestuarii]QIZ71845.1 class I SAM-dependent methyltransferase [Oxynema aestuarii AP17]RMH76689.1 MAG: class I SAM-dependent methyltransferase [Cyanobacteria bacterium J007]
MQLKPNQRTKLDESDDRLFYAYPRFVTHVDNGFIDRLTQLYRDRLRPKAEILDLMSSWVSHLPDDLEFSRVVGHGLNEEELAKNRCFDEYFVQDLNKNPILPLEDNRFDAVLNAVSVQYLQQPEIIFGEMLRVLKPGGVAIVSFSNRMFYQKAIQAWRDGSEGDRLKLVKGYFNSVEGFGEVEAIARQSEVPTILQLLGMGGGDPFYAVVAEKKVP